MPWTGGCARETRAGLWCLAIAATLTAGCGSSALGARKCQVDADCGAAGAVCRAGTCRATLALAIASPRDGIATNGVVPVHVTASVEGGQPGAVEIVLDAGGTESTLATVGPPEYAYDWDTSATPDGTYALRARVVYGTDRYESLPVIVVVDRRPPPAPTIVVISPTSARPVPVTGMAESGSTVILYEGAVELTRATADAAGAWSAALVLADGTHEITATAMDAAGNLSPQPPASAEVVCLRGGLTVVSRAPAAKENVWSRDPITVTFSRALEPDTVNGGSVQYLVNGQVQVAEFSPRAPAEDGSQTWVIRPQELPVVSSGSATVGVALSSTIRDLAGNPLTPPEDAWTWTVPAWQTLGSPFPTMTGYPSYEVSIAVDAGGDVAVAGNMLDGRQGYGNAFVSKWSGGSWQSFMTQATRWSERVSVQLDASGHPAAAWNAGLGSIPNEHPHAVAWMGTAGTAGAGGLVDDGAPTTDGASGPVGVWLDESGVLFAAWCSSGLLASRWHDGVWSPLGQAAVSSCNDIRIIGDGPLVTFRPDRDPSTGNAPVCFGVPQGTWTPTCLSTNGDYGEVRLPPGEPYGAFHAYVSFSSLVVEQFACTWLHGCEGPAGRAWAALGPSLNINAASVAIVPDLELDPGGNPLAAWSEDGSIYVKRWGGVSGEWQLLGGGSLRTTAELGSASQIAIAVGPTGVVAVAWAANDSVQGHSVYVKRYNR